MARREYAPFRVLDLQEVESREAHRVPRVVEDVGAIVAPQQSVAEPVIGVQGARQRPEPGGDTVALARDVGAHYADQSRHALLVLGGQAPRHFAADAEAEHEERHEHHHAEGREEAGPERHGARCTVPS